MSERQSEIALSADQISVDDEGRIVIKDKNLAAAVSAAEAEHPNRLTATFLVNNFCPPDV